MAKQIDPTALIGEVTHAFNLGHYWEVTGYDPEEDEYILKLTNGNGEHPTRPMMLKPSACETKRVPRHQIC